jgi:hypothetical protein
MSLIKMFLRSKKALSKKFLRRAKNELKRKWHKLEKLMPVWPVRLSNIFSPE